MVPSSPNRAGLWLLEEAHPQLGLAGVFGLKTYVMAGLKLRISVCFAFSAFLPKTESKQWFKCMGDACFV
jgi:hypothetical protein